MQMRPKIRGSGGGLAKSLEEEEEVREKNREQEFLVG